MNCTICLNEGSNVVGMYNDCVIECLEKIKTHYMNIKKQLCDKDLVINTLKETNLHLENTINSYEQTHYKSRKKCRTSSVEDDIYKLKSSEFQENPVDKSLDDLNMALNDEMEFEISFINNSIGKHEEKPSVVKREPMKNISLSVNKCLKNISGLSNKKTTVCKPEISNRDHKENIKNKSSNWISKENEINRSIIGSFYKHSSRKPIKFDHKSPRLSLKAGKFRQTRLQMDINKNVSSDGDSTFCEEAIEASPNADSKLKKASSRQWLLRNSSNKVDNPNNDSLFEMSKSCTKHLETEKSQADDKESDSSSVVMLTPATQDIIFLDDSCGSFNIESMDLLRDLMNPSETHLTNLRRMESNRIKLLQKTVGEKTEHLANKCLDNEAKNLKCFSKTDEGNAKLITAEMNESISECLRDAITGDKTKPKHQTEQKKELKTSPLISTKDESYESARRQRLLKVDCVECRTYIKYLGARLTDEEVERHIQNCSKHKKCIEVNLTPDGFWDPLIKPLDKDDPRNETLIDDRFIGGQMCE